MTERQKYKEVLDICLATCKTKGWISQLKTKDKKFQFASINVTQYYNNDTIEGVIDITITKKGVECSIIKTSFHSYGLDTLLRAISLKLTELSWLEQSDEKNDTQKELIAINILNTILKNFDICARQIKRRYNNRTSMDMQDEYDVQDLLHCLLRAYFNDVRVEEYTPSYAGSASRVDFLLKNERIVIEVKYATQKLKEKEIGNQLIIDIKKYQAHPDCKKLYCLVYDPLSIIRNPFALENDLSGKHNKIQVEVLVVPH